MSVVLYNFLCPCVCCGCVCVCVEMDTRVRCSLTLAGLFRRVHVSLQVSKDITFQKWSFPGMPISPSSPHFNSLRVHEFFWRPYRVYDVSGPGRGYSCFLRHPFPLHVHSARWGGGDGCQGEEIVLLLALPFSPTSYPLLCRFASMADVVALRCPLCLS